MDISKMQFCKDPSKGEKSPLIPKNSFPHRNRFEYVKKWQKDAFDKSINLKCIKNQNPKWKMPKYSNNHSTLSISHLKTSNHTKIFLRILSTL